MSLIPRLFLLLLLIGTGPLLWTVESPANATPAVPAAMAKDWHSDPVAAKGAADNQAKTTAETAPEPSGWWAQAAGWAAGAVGVLIALGKFVPGIGGAVAQIAGPIYDAVVSKRVRDSEKRRDALSDGMLTVVHLLQSLPADSTVADLKSKLSRRFPSATQDVINAWIKEQEEKKAAEQKIVVVKSEAAEHSLS